MEGERNTEVEEKANKERGVKGEARKRKTEGRDGN